MHCSGNLDLFLSCSTDLWTDGSSRMNASFHFFPKTWLENPKKWIKHRCLFGFFAKPAVVLEGEHNIEPDQESQTCKPDQRRNVHCSRWSFSRFSVSHGWYDRKNAFSSRNSSRPSSLSFFGLRSRKMNTTREMNWDLMWLMLDSMFWEVERFIINLHSFHFLSTAWPDVCFHVTNERDERWETDNECREYPWNRMPLSRFLLSWVYLLSFQLTEIPFSICNLVISSGLLVLGCVPFFVFISFSFLSLVSFNLYLLSFH